MAGEREYSVKVVEPGAWDEVIRQFPEHTMFHTLPWLETIRAVHGAKPVLMRVEVEGRCCAAWPMLTARKGPLRVMGSPLPGWSTAYMGPVFDCAANVEGALRALLAQEPFRRCAYFACKALNERHPIDLTPHGFVRVLDFDTYCMDLTQGEEGLWAGLKGECRTQVRKAQRLGVEVRQETDASFIDEYWAMTVETFANTQIAPMFSKQFVEEMWKRMREAGRVHALSAWLHGERTATMVLPFDEHTMYYWGGGSFKRHGKIPLHNILHWEAIRWAKELGLRRYDFVSTVGGGGRFKKTFGPEVVQMATHWERTSSGFTRALKGVYEWYVMRRQRVKRAR